MKKKGTDGMKTETYATDTKCGGEILAVEKGRRLRRDRHEDA